jgi:hypothetical protein
MPITHEKPLTLEQIETQIACHSKVVQKWRDHLDEYHRNSTIACPTCKQEHKLRDLIYLQTHYYHDPVGCIGGDYWSNDEGQADCITPGCKARWRFYNNPDVVAKKKYFGKVVDVYDK